MVSQDFRDIYRRRLHLNLIVVIAGLLISAVVIILSVTVGEFCGLLVLALI